MPSKRKQPCQCCRVERCAEGKCRVTLPSSCICLSGTHVQTNHGLTSNLCDCIVFADVHEMFYAAPIELKGGNVHASHALKQLQGGADLADSILATGDQLVPILVVQKSDPFEVRYFNQHRIRFRGSSIPVERIRCGTSAARRIEGVLSTK